MRKGDRDISRTCSSLGFKRDLKGYRPGVPLSPSFSLVPISLGFSFFLSFYRGEMREEFLMRRLGLRLGILPLCVFLPTGDNPSKDRPRLCVRVPIQISKGHLRYPSFPYHSRGMYQDCSHQGRGALQGGTP